MSNMTRSTMDGLAPRARRALVAICSVAAMLLAVGVASATAASGIVEYEAKSTSTQAGGHPNVLMRMHYLSSRDEPRGECAGCEDPRIVSFHFPTGFIGNPHSQPTCTMAEFSIADCPISSQIGIAISGLGFPGLEGLYIPLYNVVPHPNQAGQVGFIYPIFNFPTFIDLRSRTNSDYGLDSVTFPIAHPFVLPELGVELWGVPADPVNDFYRFKTPLSFFGLCSGLLGAPCGDGNYSGHPSPAPPVPYLENPTTCGEELTASVDIEYYDGATAHKDASWPATTGCQLLTFNPSISVTPTTSQADTASGVDIDLKVPQPLSPDTPSASEIRTTRTTMPVGFSINPNAADGKEVCKPSQTAIGTLGAAHCPEASKVGTVSLDISALPGPIPGALYLGEPLPGERYRLVLAANGFATHVKLLGTVRADPATGRLVVEFRDLPQSPMQRFNMHIFGSERGMLATPTACGKYPVETEFVPWDNALPVQHSTSFFMVETGPNGGPCPSGSRPLSPTLQAGSANPTAGMQTAFNLRLAREDGDQNLTALNVQLPPGLLASLQGVSYCPEAALNALQTPGYSGLAEAASPACPASSQIGTAVAGSGAGTHPVYNPGRVYLAGPYKGAPLSLVVVVPAVVGPYDLGTVAVRAALYVNPATAQVTAISDPLPLIIEGVPLRLRSVQLSLDRPAFTVNPTNCASKSVAATVFGNEGGQAEVTRHFQVANCAELAYGPKLSLKFTGGVRRRGHPAIHAVVTTKPGEANTQGVSVTLPTNELLENAHLQTVCTDVAFQREECPPGSLVGQAEATSPLLEIPLSGPVYLRSSSHRLPDLVVALKGQIDLELDGRVDSVKGGLRTTFEGVPDAAFERFALNLAGGKKGLVTNSESLCGATVRRAVVTMTGQNEVTTRRRARLRVACGSKKARHRRGRS